MGLKITFFVFKNQNLQKFDSVKKKNTKKRVFFFDIFQSLYFYLKDNKKNRTKFEPQFTKKHIFKNVYFHDFY